MTRRALIASGIVTYAQSALGDTEVRNLSVPPRLVINPFAFGAKGDGRSDDTAALEAALATGAPVDLGYGRFRITRGLMLRRGQVLQGASSHSCMIVVDHEFDRSATAIIDLQGPEPGGELRDLAIVFSQPDVESRNALLAYPPAIRAQQVPRFKLSRLRIERARTGLDMRGNSGGATIDDLEISAFDRAIWIDGSLDSVKISKLHIWPFGMTKAQRVIYDDSTNEGVRVGRCDDLQLSNSLLFGLRKAAIFYRSDKGGTFGTISSVDFDHCGGLICETGNLRAIGCVFTLGVPDGVWMRAGKGLVTAVGCWFHANKQLAEPGLASQEAGLLALSACTFTTGEGDFTHIDIGSQTTFNAQGLIFSKAPGKDYGQPLLRLRPGVTGAVSDLIASPARSGILVLADGTAARTAEGAIRIGAVQAPGWRVTR